jgi:hypothetical protein
MDDLHTFLTNNPKCAEALSRVVKHPEEFSLVSIPDPPEVLNKTLRELGDIGDVKLGKFIGQPGEVAERGKSSRTRRGFRAGVIG